MDLRILLLLVLALGFSCVCNARVVTTDIFPEENGIDTSAFPLLQQIHLQQQQESEVDVEEELRKNKELCKLCKKMAVPMLKLLKNRSTQKKMKSFLNNICSLLPSKDKLQCNLKVNTFYHAFVLQVSIWTPTSFCATLKLCDLIPIPSNHLSEDGHESCHDLVTEVSLKLKDPNIQLKITEVLFKGCDVLEEFEGLAEKCKMQVHIYAPLILQNAEQLFYP